MAVLAACWSCWLAPHVAGSAMGIVVVAMSSVSCVVSVLELCRDVFAEDSVGCLEGSGFRGGSP